MSRIRRALTGTMVAATLAGGLTPLTALTARAADPDGTITLASGDTPAQQQPVVIGHSSAGTIARLLNANAEVIGAVLVPDDGSPAVSLPWLPGLRGVSITGPMVTGTACDPSCHLDWHVLPDGPSGSTTSYHDVVASTPDGWVDVDQAPVTGYHAVRVVAATGDRVDLGYPAGMQDRTPTEAVADETGVAVRFVDKAWYLRWDTPGQWAPIPIPAGADSRFLRLEQTLEGEVLYRWPELNGGATHLSRWHPDGTTTTYDVPNAVSVPHAEAMTHDLTAWTDDATHTIQQAPATGGPSQTLTLPGVHVLGSLYGDHDRLHLSYNSTEPGVVGTYDAPGRDGSDLQRTWVAPTRQLEAFQVAAGGGRLAWVDDADRTWGVRQRTATGDATSPMSLGTVTAMQPVPASAAMPVSVSVSGRRTAYIDQSSTVAAHVQVDGAASATTLTMGSPQVFSYGVTLSGTRLLRDSTLFDLVTGATATLPGAVTSPRLSGSRVAFLDGAGAIVVRDLRTGTNRVAVPAATTRPVGWHGPVFDLFGTTLAWQDGQMHVTDLVTGQTTTWTAPESSATELVLSGSAVAYLAGSGKAYAAPLTADHPWTTVGPVRRLTRPATTHNLALDGSRLVWMEAVTGLPKVTPLAHVTEPPRYLGNPFAPATFRPDRGSWSAEWVFTKPLPTCTVTIRDGSTVVRTLDCTTTTGSALASWDGKDARGRTQGAGRYTWQVDAADADGTALDEDGRAAPITGTITIGGVSRVAGSDRFATSAAVSRATYAAGTPVAYVANGLAFPDALSGAAAAGHLGGPVLLTGAGSLPGAIATELARLKPKRIVVLGSTAAVSSAVETKLKGYTAGSVTRLAGADRFATSAAVSRATYAAGAPVAYLANGLAFPDALSAAPAAGHLGGPVLLTQPGSLPGAIATELARLKPQRIVVLGSTAAVSDAVMLKASGYTTGSVTRLAGADRFATSAAQSRATYPDGVPVVYVANGLAFPDALSGAPAAGAQAGPVLLVNGSSIPSAIATELTRLKPQRIVVLGSAAAVSDAVATKLAGYTD